MPSPICCNHTLKKTAVDNEEKYGIDVAITQKRSFSVDDLLKSMKDNSSTIKLVHDVSNMSVSDGFRVSD